MILKQILQPKDANVFDKNNELYIYKNACLDFQFPWRQSATISPLIQSTKLVIYEVLKVLNLFKEKVAAEMT